MKFHLFLRSLSADSCMTRRITKAGIRHEKSSGVGKTSQDIPITGETDRHNFAIGIRTFDPHKHS